MRSSPLVLLLLIGVQAVLNMGGGRALSTGAANHSIGEQTAANHRAGQQRMATGDGLSEHPPSRERQKTSHHRTRKPHREAPPGQERSPVLGPSSPASPSDISDPSVVEVDPKLFSKRRYRSSPRVVFSEVMPSHDLLEGEGEDIGEARGGRVRRRAGAQPMHRGEYSVCDSINTWLANLTRATDMAGNEVTVLPKIKINNVEMKQFFYETTCRSAPHSRAAGGGGGGGAAGGARGGRQGSKSGNSGCRGIDSRHWNSYCTNTHTYVRAMTIFKEQTAWRYIRINAACVCVLSRKSWSKRLGH